MTKKMSTLGYASSDLGYATSGTWGLVFGILALLMALYALGWVAYVRLEAGHVRHVALLPPIWETLYRLAWVPGAIGMSFAVTGIVLARRCGTLCFVAIFLLALTYGWWVLPIFFD